MAEPQAELPRVEITRYESLPKPLKIICLVLFTSGVGLFILYIFGWIIRGWVLDSFTYYYLLYTCFSTCVFLTMAGRTKDRNRVPWYDFVMAASAFGILMYFASNADSIRSIGWVPPQTTLQFALACIIGLLALESGRRMAGTPFFILCVVLGAYPLFAEHMPGVLWGYGASVPYMIGAFAFGGQGILGMPSQVMGEILIGFFLFAGMLIASGAGDFFLNFALGLLGRYRGGPAKVAVVGSGFFGSLTGAPMVNIAATGAVTIPAMKRMGYPSHYAGAIEAVASTGGTIMPPVMGAIAFVMCVLIDVPYAVVIMAAFIPAILYYWGLLVQVDAYAARVGLKGLPREEIPSLLKTLKEGWPFIAVLAFLVFGLVYMRWEAKSPVYASVLMFLLSFTSRKTMMTPRRFISMIATVGSLITYMAAVLLPVGFIMIGLTVPGTLTAITAQIVTASGSNVVLILLTAVVVCYLLGMVGISLIPYIVLAVTVVPALVSITGMNVIALHLFMIYYLIMTGITPPVAIAAFVGAALAAAPPMKTAFTSMRLAVVLYFIPFFFVFNPSLILEGPILETLYLFALCLLGIWILASGLEGYLLKIGRLGIWSRPLLVVAGLLIAFPGWMTSIVGAGLAALVIVIILITRKMVAEKLVTDSQ